MFKWIVFGLLLGCNAAKDAEESEVGLTDGESDTDSDSGAEQLSFDPTKDFYYAWEESGMSWEDSIDATHEPATMTVTFHGPVPSGADVEWTHFYRLEDYNFAPIVCDDYGDADKYDDNPSAGIENSKRTVVFENNTAKTAFSGTNDGGQSTYLDPDRYRIEPIPNHSYSVCVYSDAGDTCFLWGPCQAEIVAEYYLDVERIVNY